MPEADPLAGIRYISIDSLTPRSIGEFTVDPSIHLPIEVPEGDQQFSREHISWEAIISAMLKLLAYRPDHAHADYYRRFVLSVNPRLKEEFTGAGITKSRQGELDLGIEIFRALVGMFPDCASSRNNLALVYEQKAEILKSHGEQEQSEALEELAFQQYERALEQDPDSAASHFNFCHFYLRRRNFQRAKEHLDRFLDLNTDPQKSELSSALQRELENVNHIDTACAEAFDAIQMGREAEAISRLESLLETHPGIWNLWFLLGWAQRRSGIYAAGRISLEKALELDQQNPDTLNELAICLMELGEYQQSRNRLSQALELEPENVMLLSNLGILSMKIGKNAEAAGYFTQVLGHAPEDTLAQHYLDLLSTQ
jgi:tetratricopeptide (TPR) repeat protein